MYMLYKIYKSCLPIVNNAFIAIHISYNKIISQNIQGEINIYNSDYVTISKVSFLYFDIYKIKFWKN